MKSVAFDYDLPSRPVPGRSTTHDKSLIGDTAAHSMMVAVQRQAIEIVAASDEAREVRYALILKAFQETAIGMGKEGAQA